MSLSSLAKPPKKPAEPTGPRKFRHLAKTIKFPGTRNTSAKVSVVGCGGNGSYMLSALARINSALIALGGRGLQVTAFDPDTVSTSNVGRQLFSAADVGNNKAAVLIHRLNMFYGTAWTAVPTRYTRDHSHREDLVIGCVDSTEARVSISKESHAEWWLDLGNSRDYGQFILGQTSVPTYGEVPASRLLLAGNKTVHIGGQDPETHRTLMQILADTKVPNVLDLFPSMSEREDKNAPSCSVAESLRAQDLFINQAVATHAAALLWQWFHKGQIESIGGFVNLKTGSVRAIPVCEETWNRIVASNQPKAASKRKRSVKKKK